MADSSEVRSLLLQINANTELLRSNLSEAEKAVAAFQASTQQHLDQSDARFEVFGKSLEKLEGPLERLKSLGEVAVGALIGESFLEAGKRSLEFAGNIQFMANQIGVSTEFLQKFNYAAGQYGVATQVADTALTRFARTIGEVANGSSKEALELFDRLGVKVRDSGGNVRSTEAIYADFANGIQKLDSPAQRVTDTMTAFGREAAGLAPLAQQGAAGFDTLAEAAEQLGIVLSPDLIEHSEQVNHTLAALRQILDAQMASAVAQNAEAIERLATALEHAAVKALQFAKAHPELAAGLAAGAIGGLSAGPVGFGIGFAGGAATAYVNDGGVARVNRGVDFVKSRGGDPTTLTRAQALKAADDADAADRAAMNHLIEQRKTVPRGSQASIYLSALIEDYAKSLGANPTTGHFSKPSSEAERLGSAGAGASNDNDNALKSAQGELVSLEKAKDGASGAALTAINGEIAERQREIAFLKQGVPAELAKSLATKEGAALTKAGNDARRAANKAEEERRRGLEDDIAYATEEERLRKSILDGAKTTLANDAARDALQRQIVNTEADELAERIRDRAAKNGYSTDPKENAAREKSLLDLNERNRQQGLVNVGIERQVSDQKDVAAHAALELQGQIDLNGLAQQLATTRKARLYYELQALDLQRQAAIRQQQDIIDSVDPKVTRQQRDDAQLKISQINAAYPLQIEAARRQSAAPLSAYRDQLSSGVGDVKDDLQSLEVSAIDHLGESLDQAAERALRLHGLLGEIAADLLKMVVQREIELPLANALTGGSGGGGLSGAGGLISSVGRLFGIGGNPLGGTALDGYTGPSLSANLPDTLSLTPIDESLFAKIPGFAGGTNNAPGGLALVGEDGPEIVNLGRGATVTNAAITRSLLNGSVRAPRIAANDLAIARPQLVTVQVQANDYFDARVGAISGANVQAAAPQIAAGGAQMAQQDAARRQRRKLGQ